MEIIYVIYGGVIILRPKYYAYNGTKNVFLELDFQLEFQLRMHIGILSVWVLNNYFSLEILF